MTHWLDQPNIGTVKKKKAAPAPAALPPIAYTSMMSEKLPAVSAEAYRPIAIQQSFDKNSAYTFAGQDTKGLPGDTMKALVKAGFRGDVLKWVFAMLFLESGGFTNSLSLRDNNPGSIMWYKGQQKGTWIPSNKTYGIHFDSLDDFAAMLYRMLSSKSRPIDASSLEDYVHRLKIDNYFGTQSEQSYYDRLAGVVKRLGDMNTIYKNSDKVIREQTHKDQSKGLKWWQWGLIGVGTVVVIRTIAK
jgi:hypothetical protein